MPAPGQAGISKYYRNSLCTLYHGDCLDILPTIHNVDLAFADPPFNIGYHYDLYSDNKSDREYLDWTRTWLEAVDKTLSPTATIWVASHLRYQAEIKVLMSQLWHWRDTICWHFSFGAYRTRKPGRFTPTWVAMHYFTKGTKSTWSPPRVPSARQLKYKDKRANPNGKVPDNTWVLAGSDNYGECFGPLMNCMLESRVCGTFKERTVHPCQMPEAVLSRIISSTSNANDLVLDPFAGSGTTCVTASKLGRRSIGIEMSRQYLDKCCIPRLEMARPTL